MYLGNTTGNVKLVLTNGHRPDTLGQTGSGSKPDVDGHIAWAKGASTDRDSESLQIKVGFSLYLKQKCLSKNKYIFSYLLRRWITNCTGKVVKIDVLNGVFVQINGA